MSKFAILPFLLVVSLVGLSACADPEPDWLQLTRDYWSDPEITPSARYYTIVSVQECEPQVVEADGTAEVRCRLEVTMNQDLAEIEKELGSVIENRVVASLTHRFGHFRAGDERSVSVVTNFEKDGRHWQAVHR